MALAFNEQIEVWEVAFRQALVDLGKSWLASGEAFTASFITPATAICDNLLTLWPEAVGPQDSLILLSQDIEAHLRYYSEQHKTDYLGVTVTNSASTSVSYTMLYDLKLGLKLPVPDNDFAPDCALWVGYTILEDRDIERYLALKDSRENALVTDQTLDKLQKWQKNFSHMLASVAADLSQAISDPIGLSSALRALGGLLRQSRIMHVSIIRTKSQGVDKPQRGGEVRTETQKMREAITRQLANTSLPENLRAALRQSLKGLQEATNDKPVPLVIKQVREILVGSSAENQAAIGDKISAARNATKSNALKIADKTTERPDTKVGNTKIGTTSAELRSAEGATVKAGILPAKSEKADVAIVVSKIEAITKIEAAARGEAQVQKTSDAITTVRAKSLVKAGDASTEQNRNAPESKSRETTLHVKGERATQAESTVKGDTTRQTLAEASKAGVLRTEVPRTEARTEISRAETPRAETSRAAETPRTRAPSENKAPDNGSIKPAAQQADNKEQRPFDRVAQAGGHPPDCACEVCTGTSKSRVDVAPVSAADKLARMKAAKTAARVNANNPAPDG